MRVVEILADPAALARAAAERIVALGTAAIEAQGRFSIALSGGTTPLATLQRLSEDTSGALDWARTHLFWSDERCVPPGHPDSNYGAAKALLLDRVPLPSVNAHRIEGERDPAIAAADYETLLASSFATRAQAAPRFDLILLGLGMDGHTASLFPETIAASVLAVENRYRWVLPVHVASRESWRVTMTPALINTAAEVMLLAFGRDKADVVRDLVAKSRPPEKLPARLIDPANGRLSYFFDAAAARRLPAA
ncbi:MAG TPA: 6-phosphogluconolactonase [Steroidobacteraceae bacterium]|nr:6-phosphogluconolactonase [Steroidobacteraceae bacterium]